MYYFHCWFILDFKEKRLVVFLRSDINYSNIKVIHTESLFLFKFKSMISRKKIYYVPGLISALLIPFLFWYFGSQKYEEINISVLEFGIPAKYDPQIPVDQQNTLEHIRNQSYYKIEVKPNEARRNSKYYISEIKKLQRDNKKESGIEFILNDKNSYDDFISLLNDMKLSEQETYGVDLEKTGHFLLYIFIKIQMQKNLDMIVYFVTM